jgi:hypothetical protein
MFFCGLILSSNPEILEILIIPTTSLVTFLLLCKPIFVPRPITRRT